jgi:DNA-binding transcriptional regulator YhcF (GntR family)
MNFSVDPHSPEPPFEQIRAHVTHLAQTGTWPPGHKLPTVRALAEQLGVATNTVAKSYRALEADGIIETRGRGGTLIASREPGEAAAIAFVHQARSAGLTRDDAVRLITKNWDR